MRVAVIGLGWPGQTHARCAARIPGVEVAGLCDLQLEKAEALAPEVGASAFADYNVMLDAVRPDAVFLCTPHFVRTEPIRAIAERGIALFVEKPPAFNLDEANECAAIIATSGVVNSTGFMYRWARLTQRAREVVNGRPLIATMIRGAWPVVFWEGIPSWLRQEDQSGGPMVEQGVHLIDTARYITGDEIIEAQGFGANAVALQSNDLTVHDTVSATYRFAGGGLGSHLHNWSHSGWVWEIDTIGRDLRLTWDMASNRLFGKVDGVEIDERFDDNCYDTEITGFVEAVRAGDPTAVRSTYADSVRTLAAALSAAEAIRTGAAVRVPG